MLDFAKRFFLESQIETWAGLALIGLVLERLIQPGLKARANSTWLNIRYGVIYALAIFVITPSLGICLNYIRQKTGTGFINLDYFSVGIVQQCGAAILLIIITDLKSFAFCSGDRSCYRIATIFLLPRLRRSL